jgi:hypothetical protein
MWVPRLVTLGVSAILIIVWVAEESNNFTNGRGLEHALPTALAYMFMLAAYHLIGELAATQSTRWRARLPSLWGRLGVLTIAVVVSGLFIKAKFGWWFSLAPETRVVEDVQLYEEDVFGLGAVIVFTLYYLLNPPLSVVIGSVGGRVPTGPPRHGGSALAVDLVVVALPVVTLLLFDGPDVVIGPYVLVAIAVTLYGVARLGLELPRRGAANHRTPT